MFNKFLENGINSEEELREICNIFKDFQILLSFTPEPIYVYVSFIQFIDETNIKVNIDKALFHKIVSDLLYYSWEGMAKPH